MSELFSALSMPPCTPHILGLTGGIGAGKSYVGHLLVQAGLPLFDSDRVARDAYVSSDTVHRQVVDLLGTSVYDASGAPRYGEIARMVFGSSDESTHLLRQLEQIIHPYVSDSLVRWISNQEMPLGWVVLESAILWQSGFYRHCDAVAVVTAPERVRLLRVQKRDALSVEQVQARMDRQQLPSLRRLRQSYPNMPIYTICNDGVRVLDEQIESLLSQLTLV